MSGVSCRIFGLSVGHPMLENWLHSLPSGESGNLGVPGTWYFNRTDVAVTEICAPLLKSASLRKSSPNIPPKDWRQEEKGTTEDEMFGCHYQLDGHEFEKALGVGDGQGSMVCSSPWGHKELDTTERLDCTEYSSKGQMKTLWRKVGQSMGLWMPCGPLVELHITCDTFFCGV